MISVRPLPAVVLLILVACRSQAAETGVKRRFQAGLHALLPDETAKKSFHLSWEHRIRIPGLSQAELCR